MDGAPHQNLRMFEALCGKRAMSSVIFVTTMWDRMNTSEKLAAAELREKALEDRYCKGMIERGALMRRFTNSRDNALEILTPLLRTDHHGPVVLQEEVVDQGRSLSKTRAGKELCSKLQKIHLQQKETVQALQKLAKESKNTRDKAEAETELKRIQVEFDATLEQMTALKLGVWQKISLFISKKAGATITPVRFL